MKYLFFIIALCSLLFAACDNDSEMSISSESAGVVKQQNALPLEEANGLATATGNSTLTSAGIIYDTSLDSSWVHFTVAEATYATITFTIYKGRNTWYEVKTHSGVCSGTVSTLGSSPYVTYTEDMKTYIDVSSTLSYVEKKITSAYLPAGSYHIIASFPKDLGDKITPDGKNGHLSISVKPW